MSNVQVTHSAAGQPYTWAAAKFAWASPESGRPITEFRAYAYQAAVTTALSLAERAGRGAAKRFVESVTVFQANRLGSGKGAKEGFRVQDARGLAIASVFKQALAVAPIVGKRPKLAMQENVRVADSYRKVFGLRPCEAFGVHPSLSRVGEFYRRVNESVSLYEVGSRGLAKPHTDGFAISDDLERAIGLNVLVALRLAETINSQLAHFLSFMESLGVVGTAGKGLHIPTSESFAVGELGHEKEFGQHSATSLGVADTLTRTAAFQLLQVEPLTVSDTVARSLAMRRSEFFAIVSKVGRGVSMACNEPLVIAEQVGRVAAYRRALAEGMSISEAVGRATSISAQEAFALFDGLQRAADAVVADMILSTNLMTLDDFKDFVAYGNVPGYERWRDFIPGDYEYREALFRTVIESKNSDRGLLTGMQVTVDVPDLIDRGTATVVNASAGLRVNFNRRFHIVPDITLSIKGGVGTPAIPRLLNPDLEGFTVFLEKPDGSGANVTGTVTWAAHGY